MTGGFKTLTQRIDTLTKRVCSFGKSQNIWYALGHHGVEAFPYLTIMTYLVHPMCIHSPY